MYYTISNNIIQCKKQKQDSHLTVAAPYIPMAKARGFTVHFGKMQSVKKMLNL